MRLRRLFGRFVCGRREYDRFVWESGDFLPRLEPPAGLVLEEATEGNLGDYPDPGILPELRRLLRSGHRGLFARLEDRVVHRSWWKGHPGVSAGFAGSPLVTLQEREAFVHYCETLPGLRGRGVYPVVLREILGNCAAEGLRRVYIACESGNEASRRGILKAGFRKLDRVRVSACLGLARTHRGGSRP